MRSSEEMLRLILSVAEADERIRAVMLNGSRSNSDCPADPYQDYDVVFFVRDVQPFWDNMRWIEENFGKPSLVQKPESMSLIPPDNDGNYFYLMIFPDGIRIDLQITADPYVDDGEPAVVLLDKERFLPPIEVRKDHWYVKRPDQKEFSDCCNEFHWCLNNVAKGIARDEVSYAMDMQNRPVRDMLILMLSWYVGCEREFSVSVGKQGKYLKKYLPQELYERFKNTYSDAASEHMWEAAFEMLRLFGDAARFVAQRLHFSYDEEEEDGIRRYMDQVRGGLLK